MWNVLPLLFAMVLSFAGCKSAKKAPTDAPPTLRDIPAGAATAPVPVKDGDYPLGFPIIDVHLHTQFEGMKMPIELPVVKREEFHNQLKKAGVVGGIAHTVMGGHAYSDERAMGVMACGSAGVKVDAVEIERGLKSGKYGCIKVYLGYVHRYAYDLAYEPVYRLAQKYDVPVVFHTGDVWMAKGLLKYADPMTLDEVAVKHPKMRIVLAHCGAPWFNTGVEVAYKNPNVWCDLSAFTVGNVDEFPEDKLQQLLIKPVHWVFTYAENPKKFMFGSDYPLSDIAAYARGIMKAIPQEHWKAVFYDNALEVFPKLKSLLQATSPTAGKN
jgi:predicted TIM-barrel fold metal-dependent hydrolase